MKAIQEQAAFFAHAIGNLSTSAALLPSSPALVEAMIRPLELARRRVVVEFGPGTGPMTRRMLELMSPDSVLYAIELDEGLHRKLVASVRDPRLRAVCADASMVREILRDDGIDRADALLSSLGLSMIPARPRDAIWESALSVIRPSAPVTQFAYLHADYAVWNQGQEERFGWSRFNARKYLGTRFKDISSEFIFANVPPAWAITCKRPSRRA